MADVELDKRDMELLKVLHELAANDPDGVADMDKAAQKLGMNTVGKEQDREKFEKQGSDLATSHGRLSVTDEGRKKLEGQ
jgi:hypothetical protein